MTIDHASFEERRYTRQHDRVFHALVQQVCELDTRLRYVETILEPRTTETPPEVRAVVEQSREASSELAAMIAEIGMSLEAVVAALDTTRHPAASSPTRRSSTPAAETEATGDEPDDDVVVDLDTERQRKPAGWRASGRQPGWMPVGNN